MRTRHLWLLAATFLVSCQPSSDNRTSHVRQDIRLTDDGLTTVEGVVPQDATIELLLRQQQVPVELSATVVDAIRGVFDPRDLRARQSFWVSRTVDGLFREFRYQINADKLLRVVFHDAPGDVASSVNAEVVTLPKDYELSAAAVAITREHNSLSSAFSAAGETLLLPFQLAEAFAGDVDFNSDLHLGDSAEVLFERATRNGQFAGYGEIQAATLTLKGRRLSAIRYAGSDGHAAWYDEQGRSLRRPFLKSPLPFDPRVTSGFSSNRFHPVLGVNRPHYGVDFGAPEGTYVLAVAGGVVEMAGWAGEAGRMVRIRHASGYETAYLHLSGLGPRIWPGARVEQGAVIGYVGMTGSATGPHLDYRVAKNGAYVNPLTAFSRMPAGDPLPANLLPDFARVRDRAFVDLKTRLNSSVGAAVVSR